MWLIAALLIIFYLDLRRRHRQTWRGVNHAIRQAAGEFQDLHDMTMLMSDLELRAPLPPLTKVRMGSDLITFIRRTIRKQRPKTIVEIGSGLSTILSSYVLEELGEGRLIALEDVAPFAEETRELLRDHGLEQYATVVDAPITKCEVNGEIHNWFDYKAMGEIPNIDLLIVDGPKLSKDRYPALPLMLPYLSDDAIVITDDASHPDMQKVIERWRGENPQLSFEIVPLKLGGLVIRKSRQRSPDGQRGEPEMAMAQ
jgi:predicted O-methyltransferase YrrM